MLCTHEHDDSGQATLQANTPSLPSLADIGRLVRRHSDARLRRARLVEEIDRARQAIHACAFALRAITETDLTAATVPTLPSTDYPDHHALALSVDTLRSTCEEIEQTKALLMDAGIDMD